MKILYEGCVWDVSQLNNSVYVKFRREENPTDSMTWAVPTTRLDNLEWLLKHTEYTPERMEMWSLLAVVDSFRDLLYLSKREQTAILEALRYIRDADSAENQEMRV